MLRLRLFFSGSGFMSASASQMATRLPALTRRSDVQDITEYQAAFPAHALDSYLPVLVRAGKRVAICDALADMKPEPEKKSRKRSTKKSDRK